MIVVQYIAARDCIAITGIPAPFPPGSLEVRRQGDTLSIASPHQDTLVCAWADFTLWQRPDGTGFVSADDAYAYLAAACGTMRPVGTPTSTYPIVAASSVTVQHGYPFAPRVLIVDASGAEVETDVVHAPGAVTAIFPLPFSGTLYLG